MAIKKYFGYLMILIGFLLILSRNFLITGNVILENDLNNIENIFGIVFVIGGIVQVFMSRRIDSLDSMLDVYDNGLEKDKEGRKLNHYFMTDPRGSFGKESERTGSISLEELERQIREYRKMGKGGLELLNILRSEYSPRLNQIVFEGGQRSEIAQEFLDVLFGPETKDDKGKYRLSNEDREKIKEAFRSYDGKIDKKIKAIFKKFELSYNIGGDGHYIIYRKGRKRIKAIPKTPSDLRRGGLNTARDIINLIEENRNSEEKD